jgi:hypothetical protein
MVMRMHHIVTLYYIAYLVEVLVHMTVVCVNCDAVSLLPFKQQVQVVHSCEPRMLSPVTNRSVFCVLHQKMF